MEIKEKKVKEVNEVVGYKCDVCGDKIDVNLRFINTELSTIRYSILGGGWGERTDNFYKHVCSIKCLSKELNNADFGATILLSKGLINELNRMMKRYNRNKM